MMNNLFKSLRYFSSGFNRDPYKILGVNRGATDEQVKSAYYKLAKQYHPDLKPEFSDKFKEINEAYNVLKDPSKKKEFDFSNQNANQGPTSGEYYSNTYDNNYQFRQRESRFKQHHNQHFHSDPFGRMNQRRFTQQQIRRMFLNRRSQSYNEGNMYQSYHMIRMAMFLFFLVSFFIFSIQFMMKMYTIDQINRQRVMYGYVVEDEDYDYE